MKKPSWYLNRLSKMTVSEVLYRAQQNLLEKADKYRTHKLSSAYQPTSRMNLASIYILSENVNPEKIALWQAKLDAPLIDLAEAALCNRFDIFGKVYDFENKIDWHYDPKTGNKWPHKFWGDIDIRDGFTVGGAKFVWETNRVYCLSVLGMVFQLTGERKYAEKFFTLLQDWQDANPYPLGVNWTSGIELAIRIANFVWGLSFLKGYNFADADKESINRFVWHHARHLYRYPSKYSSNNNHAIAEAFALFLAGTFFPHLKGAQIWQERGKKVLERECQRQILADGGSCEYSTSYLSFVFDFFLLYKIVCEKSRINYDTKLDKRLEQSCDYIYSLMDGNGNIPNIGDQDSAILVNFGLNNHENFQSILNTGAVIFDRPEFKQKNFPDFKTCMLTGGRLIEQNEGLIYKDKKSAFSGQRRSRFLDESGLSVIRAVINSGEVVFVGNATPLGMQPLYAHGHLDALSFTLSVGGQEIFVDPGTYLYHSGGNWRRYFRSTAAHNTVRINETDFTGMPGDFMFGKPYQITEHLLWTEDMKSIWQAGHDAYTRLESPVYHTRQVIFDARASHFAINDIINSPGTFKVEQFFHLHPNCLLELKEGRIVVKRGEVVSELFFDKQLEIEVYKGSDAPMLGWFSKSFNHIQETYTIVCKGNFQGDVRLNTRILLASPVIR